MGSLLAVAWVLLKFTPKYECILGYDSALITPLCASLFPLWWSHSVLIVMSHSIHLIAPFLFLQVFPALSRFLPSSRAGSGPASALARPLVRRAHSAWLESSGPTWVVPWEGTPKAHCWPLRGRRATHLSVSECSR
eukprot:4587858-Pleurochrysis_carterae.AAC.4